MTINEKLRLIARGFIAERVTDAQAKSTVPVLTEAAHKLDRMEMEIEALKVEIRSNS